MAKKNGSQKRKSSEKKSDEKKSGKKNPTMKGVLEEALNKKLEDKDLVPAMQDIIKGNMTLQQANVELTNQRDHLKNAMKELTTIF